MKEATKIKLIHEAKFIPFLKGEGIDIGCGNDPILPSARPFDQVDGDANEITKFIDKKFDFVFSSHSLEHMKDPRKAAQEWFDLLKPGGYMVTVVPDEDLYEQGLFPSRFNSDHKYTFTLNKGRSWSPRSINVMELCCDLTKNKQGQIIMAELQEDNYDRRLYIHRPNRWNILMGKLCGKLRSVFKSKASQAIVVKFMNKLGAVVDQTSMPDDRLAQIMFIIKKSA